MRAELFKLLKKLAVFSLPFLVYGIFVVVVDPFNYFALPSPVDDALKREISFKINYAMWKMLEYRRAPGPDILLGDSRMMSVDTELVRQASGREYYNFAYGGGSLQEALETFRFARDLTDVENVYLGLDLNNYNGSETRDRVSEVLAAEGNPLLYLTNNNTLLAALQLARAALTGGEVRIGKPEGDKDAFWQRQLEVAARIHYANYRDPAGYRSQLKEISNLCREEGINLVFIIFPTHVDLQARITDFGLDQANADFRRDLARFGLVYDFAWENEITRDRGMFKDPYHFNLEVEKAVVRTVWGGDSYHVRIYGQPTVPTERGSE